MSVFHCEETLLLAADTAAPTATTAAATTTTTITGANDFPKCSQNFAAKSLRIPMEI